MTSLATKRRTVSMISSPDLGIGLGGGGGRDHGGNSTRSFVLTSISKAEKNVSDGRRRADAPRRSSGRPTRFGDRDAIRAGDDALVVRATSTAWRNAFARHLAAAGVGARRPGRGDDDQPGRVRRRGRTASASSAPPPCCSARRGRRSRSTTPSTSPAPAHAVADGAGVALLAERLGAERGHRPRRRRPTPRAAARRPVARRPPTSPTSDEAVLVFSSGTTGLPKAVRHTHASIGARHRATGAPPSASAPTTASRSPRRRRTSSACSTCSPRPTAGATVRLHAPLRPRRGAAPHRVRPHDPRDGGGADRPGDGQPPRPRGLRPLVAPLHHVGRHAGDRERRRDGHRAHRRPVAARPTAPASCR